MNILFFLKPKSETAYIYDSSTLRQALESMEYHKYASIPLLNAVETGTVTLIGATTENPSFEVIRPLLSRCQVYVLKPLNNEDLLNLLNNALTKDVILKEKQIELKDEAHLNTDLRIVALMSLGFTDANKIAEFLHCSTQSVYNSRRLMYGRLAIPLKEFKERVTRLGRGK